MIIHIVKKEEWAHAIKQGQYTPKSLKSDGFIHCSTINQVIDVANALYRDDHHLILVCIDSEKVSSEIIYEDLYQSGQLYPHIYGPLNLDAVLKDIDFMQDDQGNFILPSEIKNR